MILIFLMDPDGFRIWTLWIPMMDNMDPNVDRMDPNVDPMDPKNGSYGSN